MKALRSHEIRQLFLHRVAFWSVTLALVAISTPDGRAQSVDAPLLDAPSLDQAPEGAGTQLYWRPLEGTYPCMQRATETTCRVEHGMLPTSARVFIPASDGDLLRVRGQVVDLGLASGPAPRSSVIRWLEPGAADDPSSNERTIALPLSSPVDFAVFETSSHPAQAYVLEQRLQPLAADRYLGSLAASSGAAAPSSMRSLERDIQPFFEAFPNAPAGAFVDLIRARSLALHGRLRPISAPFFARTTGGRRHLRATDELEIEDADLVSLRIRARLGLPTVVEVYAGDVLVSSERFRGTESGTGGRTGVRSLRVAGPRVRIRLVSGEAEVRHDGYTRRWAAFGRRLATKETPFSLYAEVIKGDSNAAQALSSYRGTQQQEALHQALLALYAPGALGITMQGRALSHPALPLSYRLHLLRRLWNTGALVPEEFCASTALSGDANPESDRFWGTGDRSLRDVWMIEAVDALGELMCQSRPSALSLSKLVSIARAKPQEGELSRWVRQILHRSVFFLRPEAPGASAQVIPLPESNGVCSSYGPHGWRYQILASGEHRFYVDRMERLGFRVRALSLGAGWQGSVELNETHVPVHGALGLESAVDLDQGPARLTVPSSAPPLLVRVPAHRTVPCGSLRDVVQTTAIGSGATVPLEHASAALGRLELRFFAGDRSLALGRAGFRKFEVVVGSAVHRVEVGPSVSTERVHIPLPLSAHRIAVVPEVSVSSDSFAVRVAHVRARAARRASEAAALPSEQALLDLVRQTSRDLARAPTRSGLRLSRARALTALGYPTWAGVDRSRLEERAEQDGVRSGSADGSLRAEVVSVPAMARRQREIRRNLLAKIAPIEVSDLRRIPTARRLFARGQYESVLDLLEEAPSSVDQLMRALAYVRLGRIEEAADAFVLVEQPAALVEAARFKLEIAERDRDPRLALESLALLTVARRGGQDVQHLLWKAKALSRWVVPSAAESAAGSRLVPRSITNRVGYLSADVRRALLDAPDDSLLLYASEWLEGRIASGAASQLSFAGGCLRVDTLAPCRLSVFLDGQPTVAARGTIEIPSGSHVLRIVSPADALAWVKVGGELGAIRTYSLYYEMTPQEPVRFAVAAPTVLRVRLGAGAPPDEVLGVEVHVDGARVDALRRDDYLEVPILGSSVHQVRLVSSHRSLIRPTVAVPVPPPPEPERETPSAFEDSLPPLSAELVSLHAGEPRFAGPLSVETHLRAVGAEIRDLDSFAEGSPHLEFGSTLFYRDSSRTQGVSALAFYRMRDGPSTLGVRATYARRSQGLLPGITLRGEVAGQRFDGLNVGLQGSARLHYRVYRHPILSIYPFAGILAFDTDQPNSSRQGLDPDVFNRFSRDHPVTVQAGAFSVFRPALDLVGRVSFVAHSNSDWRTLDRVSASLYLDALVGEGLAPWITLGYQASQRFRDAHRPTAIGRHVGLLQSRLWHWASPTGRLMFHSRAEWVIDRMEIAGFLELRYLFTPYRGVHDLPQSHAPYRARLEEGALVAEQFGVTARLN